MSPHASARHFVFRFLTSNRLCCFHHRLPSNSNMPRVKGEVELHGVPVPVGLRRHVYWKASPVLAALSKHCTNCIPPYLYRGVFDELDKLATRLEGTEPHSHSALTANDLCNQVTTAHYRRTDELLRRKENRLVPDPFRE